MKNVNEMRTGRHCVFRLHAHLVFVTKYRRGVFTRRVLDDLRAIFASVCADFEAELVEFEGEDDHVHLLVVYPPKVSVSSLVNSLKGVSSRLIRKKIIRNSGKNYLATHCGLQVTLPGAVAALLFLFCANTLKTSVHRAEDRNSSQGAPYISALKSEVLRRVG
jgi:putative transposase